jgi:hypothetical protein
MIPYTPVVFLCGQRCNGAHRIHPVRRDCFDVRLDAGAAVCNPNRNGQYLFHVIPHNPFFLISQEGVQHRSP